MVGTLASGVSVQVAETVTGPARILQISPASTSPSLTRTQTTTTSCSARRFPTRRRASFSPTWLRTRTSPPSATLYVNNAYGKGLSNAFKAAFEARAAQLRAEVPHEENQTTYASELQQCAGATRSRGYRLPGLRDDVPARGVGRQHVPALPLRRWHEGPGHVHDAGVRRIRWSAWAPLRRRCRRIRHLRSPSATQRAYGELPPKPFIKEAYDATYLIALAAQKAGSNDGTAIRDALRDVSNAPGTDISPGPDGWAAAVAAIAAGNDINYEGTG